MWSQYCFADGSLPWALGKWTHDTHCRWEWYYHPIQDVIVQQVGAEFWAYRPCLNADMVITRGSCRYRQVGTWHSKSLQDFLPTTIRHQDGEIVHLSYGPALVTCNPKPEEEFWGFVRSWGGKWKWEHAYTPLGIDAMVDAITSGITAARYGQILTAPVG
jgi:hypothetical protein